MEHWKPVTWREIRKGKRPKEPRWLQLVWTLIALGVGTWFGYCLATAF